MDKMAANDIKVLNEHLYGTTKIPVEDRNTSTHNATIKPGEPVERGKTGAVSGAAASNFAVLSLTGSPVVATNLFLGVCKEESDETATLDGHGVFYLMGLGSRLKGKASTPANMNTVALLDALLLNNVAFDGIAAKGDSAVTTPYTIDENDAADANSAGLQLIQGDILAGTLEVRVVGATCMFGTGI